MVYDFNEFMCNDIYLLISLERWGIQGYLNKSIVMLLEVRFVSIRKKRLLCCYHCKHIAVIRENPSNSITFDQQEQSAGDRVNALCLPS